MSFCSHVRSMEMQTITRVKPGPPPTRGRGSSRVGNPPGLIYVIMNVVLGTGATYATYAEPKCECSPARWVSTTTTKCAILYRSETGVQRAVPRHIDHRRECTRDPRGPRNGMRRRRQPQHGNVRSGTTAGYFACAHGGTLRILGWRSGNF